MPEKFVSPKVRKLVARSGPIKATRPMESGGIRPLLEKQFDASAYLFEKDPQKARPPSMREKEETRRAYDNEERMLRTLEQIKVGGDHGMTKIPEKLWNSIKDFTSQVVSTRRQNAKEMEEKQKKLRDFETLQDLEHEVAELRSYWIELVRELASEEKASADAVQLRQKINEALAQTDVMSRETKGLFNQIFSSKIMADQLHSQLYTARKYSMLKNTKPESILPSGGAEKNDFQEGRVIFRATRMFCDRPCIVSIYVHDLRMNHFREDTPYSQPTITPVWQGDDTSQRARGGMSELFRTLLTEESREGAGDPPEPIYLIVVYDVCCGQYYMLEHMPKRDLNAPHQIEETVIAHVNAHLSLVEDVDGTLKMRMPNTNHPLRLIWKGVQEIAGDRPHEFFPVSILEFNVRTWLVRVYDVALCKVYTHLLPKDVNDDLEHLISVVTTRLHFSHGLLSMEQSPARKRLLGTEKNTVDTLANERELWPDSLRVKVSKEFGDRIALVQAAVSPSLNVMRITVSDYINDFVVKDKYCFSDVCLSFAAIQKSEGDLRGLAGVLEQIATVAIELEKAHNAKVARPRRKTSLPRKSRSMPTSSELQQLANEKDSSDDEVEPLDDKTVYGISDVTYTTTITALVNSISLNGDSIAFPQPESPRQSENSPTTIEKLWRSHRKDTSNV